MLSEQKIPDINHPHPSLVSLAVQSTLLYSRGKEICMPKRIVLIGAGSAQFGSGTLGDIFQSGILKGSEIVLHDINESALAVMQKKADRALEKYRLEFSVSSSLDRREALKGADFVIISIEVGDRFALWDLDRTIPQHYGIRQVFGENGGPGGLFHSLRIIPPILDIAQDIMDICPAAFVFNYSNPMSRIVTTVKRKFPDLKLVGLCHEIASLEEHLPAILDMPLENIKYRAGGLNHFSALIEAEYRNTGKNAYPEIMSKAGDYFRTQSGYSELWKFIRENFGPLLKGSASGGDLDLSLIVPVLRKFLKDSIPERMGDDEVLAILNTEGFHSFNLKSFLAPLREWSDRQLFRVIFETFNLLPITGDSHLGEYVQWAYSAADIKGIIDFYAMYRTMLSVFTPEISLKMGERVVPIMEGIITDSGYEEPAVNILNDGYIKDLPSWIAVEVPARIDAKGVHGVKLDMPAGFRGLLTNQIGIHDLTAEAVLHKSKKIAHQALLVDPVVDTSAGLKDMLEFIIESESPYLNYLT